jgi:hypothetical protein
LRIKIKVWVAHNADDIDHKPTSFSGSILFGGAVAYTLRTRCCHILATCDRSTFVPPEKEKYGKFRV